MTVRTLMLACLLACPSLFASYADSAPGVIDTVAPQVSLDSVLDAQLVQGTDVYVEYSVTDQSAQAPLVTITAEGAGLSVPMHTTLGYGANFNWPCELELGIYQFHFHVQDACGNFCDTWSTEFEVIEEAVASADEQPASFALLGAHPNPFNPGTVIHYALAQTEETSLCVYNLRGQRVADLYHGLQDSGEHQVFFDGSALASGIYIVRLQAGERVAQHKITLLK